MIRCGLLSCNSFFYLRVTPPKIYQLAAPQSSSGTFLKDILRISTLSSSDQLAHFKQLGFARNSAESHLKHLENSWIFTIWTRSLNSSKNFPGLLHLLKL